MREHDAGGWVMDGNYLSALGDTDTFAAATDVICMYAQCTAPAFRACSFHFRRARPPYLHVRLPGLDPPFVLYFPRLLWRTFARLCRFGTPCAPGCDEDWREVFFSRNSIILWCITHHSSVRRRYEGMWEPVENGGKWRRLGGWGGDFQQWWNGVELIAKSR